MNRFIRTNSPWLTLLGLAVIIVALAFILRPKSPHYLLNAKETISAMNDRSIEVDINEIPGKQLIDIRSSELYLEGHPASGVNIPIRQILDKDSLELLDNLLANNKEAVLYGTNELQATAPVFLLRQLGYKNVKLLKGGLNQGNEFIRADRPTTEVSIIDTTVIHGNSEPITIPASAATIRKGEAVIPIRKGASAGGGC